MPAASGFQLDYRADIDGLRAVAILLVVGFHAFPKILPGGFVGVDVFFVISGFLITRILLKSLADSDFSLLDFYAHRVRRIFPALIVVLAFCLVMGWRGMVGSEVEKLGIHTVGAVAFVENFVLWGEAGYFEFSSELKPLLHFWSLAVEEQFYLVFPVVLWATWRLGISLLIPTVAIFVASLLANLIIVQQEPASAFYLPYTRFWELMAGSLVAWSTGRIALSERLGRAARTALSCFGLLAIAFAGLYLDKSFAYPGGWALLPVGGTALAILCGRDAWPNGRILSNKPALFVGRISYPLYLWHWPLLSFSVVFSGEELDLNLRMALVVASFILAWLTYRFVEKPIRTRRISFPQIASLVGGLMIIGVGGAAVARYPRAYDEAMQKIVQNWTFEHYPGPAGGRNDSRYNLLTFGDNTSDKVVFVGDSHSAQYDHTVATALVRLSKPGGASLREALFLRGEWPPVFPQEMLRDPAISTVVFSYFWAIQYRSERVNQEVRCCGSGMLGPRSYLAASTQAQVEEYDRKLGETLRSLRQAGKNVYVVLDNPFGKELSPRFLIGRGFFSPVRVAITPLTREEADRRREPIRTRVAAIAEQAGAVTIDPFATLCDDICHALSTQGIPLYRDYDHLSLDALINVATYLDVTLDPAVRQSQLGQGDAPK